MLFIDIFNQSVSALWLILAVIVLRPILFRAPRWTRGIMWGIVALRLILPLSLESKLSLIPSTNTLPPEFINSPSPEIQSGIPSVDAVVNPFLQSGLTPSIGESTSPASVLMYIASYVWLIGIGVLIGYMALSYCLLCRRVRLSVPHDGNIRLCDEISSPFLFGIVRPRIYIPSSLPAEHVPYVVAHERAHIRRLDNIFKPLGFIIASIFWFAPWVWVAYMLFCRDMEMSCDESAIKALGDEHRKKYAEALIECAAPSTIGLIPLAFGETSVKGRIKSVMKHRKPALIWLIITIITALAMSACFLTSPVRSLFRDGESEVYYPYLHYQTDTVSGPFLRLDPKSGGFLLSFSYYDSTLAYGKYTVDGDTITLKSDNGGDTYVFRSSGDDYVLDASLSSQTRLDDGYVFHYTSRSGQFLYDFDKDGTNETVTLHVTPFNDKTRVVVSVLGSVEAYDEFDLSPNKSVTAATTDEGELIFIAYDIKGESISYISRYSVTVSGGKLILNKYNK